MKFDFSDELWIDINNFEKLAFCKKNVSQKKKMLLFRACFHKINEFNFWKN